MRTIKHLLAPNKYAFWVAALWTTIIVFLSFKTPSSEPKLYFENADKIVHFTFYFGFVFLWFRFLLFQKKGIFRNLFLFVLIAIFLGVLIEILQGLLTTTRQPDVWDAVANSFGSLMGAIVSYKIVYKS